MRCITTNLQIFSAWAISSVGEHRVHIAGVTGSSPVSPTIKSIEAGVKKIMPTFCNLQKINTTIVAIVVSGTLLMGNFKSKADTANIFSQKEEINKTGLPSLYSSPTDLANSTSVPKLVNQMKTFKLTINTSARPDISWKDANDNKVTLELFGGKVVLLNFWASWCLPCIRELPSINRLQAKLGGDKFTVIALNIDRGGKPIANRFRRKLKLDKLDLHIDQKNAVARLLKIKALPTTIVFDSKGREVGKMEAAAEWDTKEALSLIQYFINNPNHADKISQKKSIHLNIKQEK